MSEYFNESMCELINKSFPALNDNLNLSEIHKISSTNQHSEFNRAVELIKKLNLSKSLLKIIVNKIERRLRNEIIPEFWSYFQHSVNDNYFKQFYNAVKFLYDNYMILQEIFVKIGCLNDVGDRIYNEDNPLKLVFKATLLSQLKLEYQNVCNNFYETALKMEDIDEASCSTSAQQCLVCVQNSLYCNCINLFQETNRKLGDMGLLEALVGQTLTTLSYNYIFTHIQKICKDNFETSYTAVLEKWVQDVILLWLKRIYQYDTSLPLEEAVEMLDKKLTIFLFNTYTKIRIEQLFNIIIEYPESLAALEDIKSCLPRTDLKWFLMQKLQKAMETRLLHPGVSTPDILTAYVASIRSLRVLDPSGLLLETVTKPVHQYLRSREDTVRCVVSSLTEEGPNDLADELTRGGDVVVNENNAASSGALMGTQQDDCDDDWENWTPDPIDAPPQNKRNLKEPALNTSAVKAATSGSSTRRTSDIISMLVNIYGSKELFVNEYRTLLADRLLSQCTCDTEKEIRYLELLKLRFGESHLHFCEVMLKDIADSKRINQNVAKEQQNVDTNTDDISLSTMIVSQQFWPPFKEEKLELHSKVTKKMEEFTKAFETLKGSRTLCWKNHLGVVDLEVETGDRVLNLSVSPVHATILMHFQDKATWELDELSKLMQCPPTVLRRKIGFWLSHSVLVETKTDVFTIHDNRRMSDSHKRHTVMHEADVYVEDYESESAMASAKDQKEEELQNIWSYILGMLMNLDSLSLERIHHMLKMFAFQGPTNECTMSELKMFLDRKVREREVIFANGLYKLPK